MRQKTKTKIITTVRQIAVITGGALIYAVGLNGLLAANGFASGGLSGLALLGWYQFQIPIGLSYAVLNVPLLIAGWRFLGHQFLLLTAAGVASTSVMIELTSSLAVPLDDPLLVALLAGGITGAGLGLIFTQGATTGGVDIVSRLLRHFAGIEIGVSLFAQDLLILGVSALVIDTEIVLYSIVAMFVASRTVDAVQSGFYHAKTVLIITQQPDRIKPLVLKDLNRGLTDIPATGGYTDHSRKVLMSAMSRGEAAQLKRKVREVDPSAFMLVFDAGEIVGRGFRTDLS